MRLKSYGSRTKFVKLVKAELAKVSGKTIQSVTWRDDDMTIHFTDNTHLRLAPELYNVSIEALLRGESNEDKFFNEAAEKSDMQHLCEKGLTAY